ncbi:MAG: 2-C-methyl-D-erythritol 4-phosphate cytidylyltransferase [Lachnospiraceae bacterium]|nr:2-C-methyl-D-erythritol 4-phosphate cytidylyltransferase [Lachnospiraceae bacterium]
MEKHIAIVLAAGQGKRMQSKVQKQYLLLQGRPVLYYSLKAFEDSFVDEIILVTGAGDIEYCQKEIVEKYNFQKVRSIVPGGKERYHSVYAGLCAAEQMGADYIYIQDGARPMLIEEILDRLRHTVELEKACVAGMPVKDTIKIADESGYVDTTPKRELVWMIQTPQVFDFQWIKQAYDKLIQEEVQVLEAGISITDDAMVLEHFMKKKVKLVEGSYENIKITTPEDLPIAESFLKELNQ